MISLRPKDEEDRKAFWEFQCEEIVNAFRFQIWYYALLVLVYIISYISSRDSISIWTPILVSTVLIAYILVWLSGRRFTKQFVYILVLMYVYLNIVNIANTYAVRTKIATTD